MHQGPGSQRFLACIAGGPGSPFSSTSQLKFCRSVARQQPALAPCSQATLSQQAPGFRRGIWTPCACPGLANSPLTLPAPLGTPTGGDPSPTQITLPSCTVTHAGNLFPSTRTRGSRRQKQLSKGGRRGKASSRAPQPPSPDSQDGQLTERGSNKMT